MRTIRAVTEDEVIAAFLRAEIDSDRFGQAILKALQADNQPRTIVDVPNLNDHRQNACRRSLLGRVRGWGKGEGMFQGFPVHVDWELVALAPDELAAIRYIAWDWWLDRSAGTGFLRLLDHLPCSMDPAPHGLRLDTKQAPCLFRRQPDPFDEDDGFTLLRRQHGEHPHRLRLHLSDLARVGRQGWRSHESGLQLRPSLATAMQIQ